MGSGKLLRYAIQKYGKKNFKKEILCIFNNEEEMNQKEAELVNEEFCNRNDTYNICSGGKGGWSYVNNNESLRTKGHCPEMYKIISLKLKGKKRPDITELMIKRHKLGIGIRYDTFTGKKHSIETKRKISKKLKVASKGSKNSQFGTMWITNGVENRKIKKIDNIPDGWYNGRIMEKKNG